MSVLSRLFRTAPPVQGYLYVPSEETGPAARAAAGAIVRNPDRTPPWLVVHHRLTAVIAAPWPGRLWRVEAGDAIRSADLLAGAPFTRAASVKVLEELPAHLLFGAHGAAVVPLLDAARALTRAQAERLAAARDAGASAAANRVWQAWLDKTDPASPQCGQDLGDTLRLGGENRSPVDSGLSVLHQCVVRRAVSIDGENATEMDDDDDVVLVAPWFAAASALGDAMLALGAPDFVTPEDRGVLSKAWAAVFN